MVILFLSGLPGLSGAPTGVAILVLLAWIIAVRTSGPDVRAMSTAHRGTLLALVAFLSWLTLSITWSLSPSGAEEDVRKWLIAATTFVVIATTVRSARGCALLAGAFVAGAALAVIAGLAMTGLQPASNAINSAQDARLSTGATDPNYLAAMLVAALALSAGLAAWRREPWVRIALASTAPLLLYGLVATQSRGGLIAAAVAIVTAIVFLPAQRRRALAATVPLLAVVALFFAVNPAAYQRVTQKDGGGTGRSELWRIAWQMSADHPLVGVGVNNFLVREQAYVRKVGPLKFAELVTDDPKVVHNMYLQMLAETGVIGLALFLMVIGALLRATYRAARLLERTGDVAGGTFARCVLVSQLAMLTASVFLSNGPDRRYWVLFALGPALWAVARTRSHAQDDTAPAGQTIS
ncbi:MAG: O-antigen polymerase [Solirubrobacterales bacterium]|nr:O-antigen polymerase [Solirubrobacterales bacterium]